MSRVAVLSPRLVKRSLGALAALAALLLAPTACDRPPPAPPRPAAPPPASAPADNGPSRSPAATRPRVIPLTERMQALATQPAGRATDLFLDRRQPDDLRVMSYNVNWDKIFPDKDALGAEKFQRVVKALDPDIMSLQEIRENSADDVVALLNAVAPLPDGGTWHAYKGWTNVIVSRYPLRLTADRPDPPGQRQLALALVDLPDDRFPLDVYVINIHHKCCGGTANDPQRQQQSDALAAWIRDARTPGGRIDLPARTAVVIAGDLNLVGGPQPLLTLLTGDIQDEARYGPDAAPDWDDTTMTDAHPRHNATGPDDYTWRNDLDQFDPGRLDYVLYTDSVLEAVHAFVLNTTTLDPEALARSGLEWCDIALDLVGKELDHLPVVVDFRPAQR